MGFDTAHGCAVSADLDGINAGLIQQSADGEAFLPGESAVGEVIAVDLDGDMKLRRGPVDPVQDFQQDPGAVFDASAVCIGPVVDRGLRVALATNPLFPAIATQARIRWTGLQPEEFEFFTTYENIGWCKPNPDYYREVLRRAGLQGEDCLMVGNDVGEDMVAAELGMKVFLLTDCLINKSGEDISVYPNGSFEELKTYVSRLVQE